MVSCGGSGEGSHGDSQSKTGGQTGTAANGTNPWGADLCFGPVVSIAAQSSVFETCTGRIAEGRFLNALCTCNDATVAGYLKTRGFDSSNGRALEADEGAGSAGINRTYAITEGFTDVGGALTIACSESPSFAGYLRVDGLLRLAGEASVAGYAKAHDDRDEPLPPSDTCDQCGSCTGGTARVDGTCGACRSDGDCCCSPLACRDGTCVQNVVLL